MNLGQVKQLLKQQDLPVWKLIRTMGISRNTFYSLSHQRFSGAENKLNQALKQLGVSKHEKP